MRMRRLKCDVSDWLTDSVTNRHKSLSCYSQLKMNGNFLFLVLWSVPPPSPHIFFLLWWLPKFGMDKISNCLTCYIWGLQEVRGRAGVTEDQPWLQRRRLHSANGRGGRAQRLLLLRQGAGQGGPRHSGRDTQIFVINKFLYAFGRIEKKSEIFQLT